MKKIIILLFVLAFTLRLYSIFPNKIILGYDQIRDLFVAKNMWIDKDLKIIGPTAGNNLNLHHGVAFLYYILPPIVIFNGNPFWISVWNCFISSFAVIIIYLFSKSLFKDKVAAAISAYITAVSYYFISYAGWIGNPSPTLVTVPLTFYFLWKFINGNQKSLIFSLLFLGLSIQFELFFIYLIPVLIGILILFRQKLPNKKIIILSLLIFLLTISTMIATEIKYNFSGMKDIFGAVFMGETQGQGIINNLLAMINGFFETFSDSIWPRNITFGKLFALFTLLFFLINVKKKPFFFLLIYFLSPLVMVIAGFHGSPWFLIGLPPAIAISSGYLISKLKHPILIILSCFLIYYVNFDVDTNLLGADDSSILTNQMVVIDYTYQSSNYKNFTINSVTNPLYINYPWAYNYGWYGLKKYGYLPTWTGGDQLPPYDVLANSNNDEEYIYLIIDQTPRIPNIYKDNAYDWANKISLLVEEKKFEGLIVQKRRLFHKI
ncbi:MAG: glycosyltransferase family 39 protein [Patescibacteria group bacterium]